MEMVRTMGAEEDATIEKMTLKISPLAKMDIIWHIPSMGQGPHLHQKFFLYSSL